METLTIPCYYDYEYEDSCQLQEVRGGGTAYPNAFDETANIKKRREGKDRPRRRVEGEVT